MGQTAHISVYILVLRCQTCLQLLAQTCIQRRFTPAMHHPAKVSLFRGQPQKGTKPFNRLGREQAFVKFHMQVCGRQDRLQTAQCSLLIRAQGKVAIVACQIGGNFALKGFWATLANIHADV